MAEQRGDSMTCSEATELAAGFVLGSLEPGEMARVREHLATCGQPHPEFEELGAVVPALARSVPIAEPSSDLGPRILAAARAEQARTAAADGAPAAEVSSAGTPALRPAPIPVPVPVPLPPERRRPPTFPDVVRDLVRRPAWGLAAVAAVVAIAVLGAWNLQLRSQVDDLAAYRDGVAAVLHAAAAPGAQIAVLGPADGSATNGLAAVDPAGRLVIAMRNLAPTSGTQVYEAWLIGADGKPVPAGSFAVAASGTGTLTSAVGSAESGVVVALTLEPAPGATTPTLPVLAKGAGRPASG